MNIYSRISFFVVCLIGMGSTCCSGEVSAREALNSLTPLKGVAYFNQRDSLLKEPDQLRGIIKLKLNGANDSLQKRILVAWSSNAEIFNDMLKGMSRYEVISMNSVRKRNPDPISFAKSWLSQHESKLSLLAIEAVWKRDDWPQWRTLAMIEILKKHADDALLVPIVDRLSTEKDKKVRTSVLELLNTKGGTKTLERIKEVAEKIKDDAEEMVGCAKSIKERLEKEKKPDVNDDENKNSNQPKKPAPDATTHENLVTDNKDEIPPTKKEEGEEGDHPNPAEE